MSITREIIVELGFGQHPDALILGLDAAHHALPPPVFADPLGYRRARTIETVERNRDVLVKLRAMVRRAVADAVDHFLWNTVGILFRLHEQRRNRADEDRLCHAPLAMPGDIARHLAAAGRVADVHGVLEIERFRPARRRRRRKCPCRAHSPSASSARGHDDHEQSRGNRVPGKTSSGRPSHPHSAASHDGKTVADRCPNPCSKSAFHPLP